MIIAIQRYLVDVNADATQALAGTTATVQVFQATYIWDPHVIYSNSMPPCERYNPHHSRPAPNFASAPVAVPPLLPASLWPHETSHVVSSDGSYDGTGAGWGFTVAHQGAEASFDCCGPVVSTPGSLFCGATRLSNNTGELSGLYFSLRYIAAHYSASDTIVLEYDSEYAAGIAQRVMYPRTNLCLALRCRRAAELTSARIIWRKARSHTGLVFNEQADKLAKCGAAGIIRGSMHSWAALPP